MLSRKFSINQYFSRKAVSKTHSEVGPSCFQKYQGFLLDEYLSFNPIQFRMGLFGAIRGLGRQKSPPP